jgi:hypothetical protein
MSTHRFILTDLPNELLTLILQQLGHRELLDIACLCQRLNLIAIRLFFKDVGFDPGSTQSSLKLELWQPFTLLKGIRLSFTPKALHQLRCEFDISVLYQQMIDVQALILLLPAVSQVHLHFPAKLRTLWQSDVDQAWKTFIKVLIRLLNTLDGKSCTHLEIEGLSPPTSIKPSRGRLKVQPLNTLQKVTISTSNTLYGKLLDWIVLSLNNSPVHTLKLTTYNPQHYLYDFSMAMDFTALAVLSRTNLPHLSNLQVCVFTRMQNIVPYLHRHADITTLHITAWCHAASGIQAQYPVLPHLTKLVAVPKFIIDYLSHPEIVPDLQTVRLLTARRPYDSDELQYNFDTAEMTRTLEVLSNCRTIKCLSLTMNHGIPVGWMVMLESAVSTEAHNGTKILLPHITHLTVLRAANIPQIFPHWLSTLFPNVRVLVYDSAMAHHSQCSFVRQLVELCPTFMEVSFSGDAHPRPVVDWLEYDDVEG